MGPYIDKVQTRPEDMGNLVSSEILHVEYSKERVRP
jgi:hypothetical protein